MRFLRRFHLYLGCLFAPILIFFAVTGAWQVFDWHQSTKDGSYVAPKALRVLSSIHRDAHIPPTRRSSPAPLRYFMFVAALGLVTTTLIGVVMAYRFSREPLVATLCLTAGIVLPVALLWVYR
jgi:ammonia channel protein AmtB